MRVSRYAAGIMARLEREGHKLTPLDVLRLNAVGLRIESPAGEPSAVDCPSVAWAGDVPFHALTLAAADWLDVCAFPWWARDVGAMEKAIAYAYNQGRAAGAFDGAMLQRKTAEATISVWWRKLPCTQAEICAAVETIRCMDASLDGAPVKGMDKEPGAVRQLIADLVAATGIPADKWRGEALSFGLQTYRSWARSQAAIMGASVEESKKSAANAANALMFKLIGRIEKRKAAATNG